MLAAAQRGGSACTGYGLPRAFGPRNDTVWGRHLRLCHCEAPTGPRQSPGSNLRNISAERYFPEIATSACGLLAMTESGVPARRPRVRPPYGMDEGPSRRAATSGRPYEDVGSAPEKHKPPPVLTGGWGIIDQSRDQPSYARYRKVTIWPRVQPVLGPKVVAVRPLVTSFLTAQSTAS